MRKFLHTYMPASLLLIFLAMILWACGGGGGGGGGPVVNPVIPSEVPVTATFSLPETVNGIGWICIDNDLDPDNGNNCMGTAPGAADSFTLTFQDVPTGMYYIYGGFNLGSTQIGPPRVGDYWAICGWDGVVGNEPKNPNVEVIWPSIKTFYLYPIEVFPSVTPPAQSLTGTYNLTGFTVSYSNGTTLTEKDVSSWSGEMIIGDTTFTQTIVLEGNPIAVTGTATITYTNGTMEGIAHVIDQSGTHDVYFSCSGNYLNTYSGVVYLDPDTNFEEWDYWEKVSDAVSTSSPVKTMNQPFKSNFQWIGDVINPH